MRKLLPVLLLCCAVSSINSNLLAVSQISGSNSPKFKVNTCVTFGPTAIGTAGVNKICYADGTGPTFYDDSSEGTVQFDLQSLGPLASRFVTFPNADTKIPISTQFLTFTGPTNSRTFTFPDANATIPRSDGANTWIGTQSFATLTTTGNTGFGVAPSVTTGQWLLVGSSADEGDSIVISNTNAVGTSARSQIQVQGDTATALLIAHGTGRTVSRWGHAVGGYAEIELSAGNGLDIGTIAAKPLSLGTSSVAALVIDSSQRVQLTQQALTAGTMTATNSALAATTWSRYDWTNAMVVALGATTAGDVTICTLPAKTVVKNVYVVIDTPDTSTNALTVAVGRASASYIDYVVASDAKASANTVYGDASAERGTNLTGYDLPSITGTTAVKAHFIKTTSNLSTVTGSTGHVYIETSVLP